MPLRTKIIGNSIEYEADVSSDGFLRVDARDYYDWENKISYFSNETYGNSLVLNATSNGTPENIHDGLDDVYWTGINIIGNGAIFNSADEAYTGTQSIKWDKDNNNNVFDLTYPSGFFLVTGYTSLNGYIYLDVLNNPDESHLYVAGWDENTNTQVGSQVDILTYINKSSLKTWQSFVIPIGDLALAGREITSFRFTVVEVGKIKFYLDDILLAAPGTAVGTQTFYVNAIKEKVVSIDSIVFNITIDQDSTLADSSMPNLDYNTLLFNNLENGILYKRVKEGEILSSWVVKNLFDLLERPDATLVTVYGNASSKSIKVKWSFFENHILNYAPRDYLSLTVSDNLSTYSKFSVLASMKMRDL